jgi:delta1-piperideine-2-carboxylate reductase
VTEEQVSFAELVALVEAVLVNGGFSPPNARVIAEIVAAAERDGARSHGLFRLAGYLSEVGSGWARGDAVPRLTRTDGAVIGVDGDNGYCQPAYRLARDLLCERARALGVAALAIRNAHHLAALWPEAEDLAARGFVALVFRGSRALVAPPGGRRPVFGTNPMAFACPRPAGGQPPIVFDMATSAMARGEISLAAEAGHAVPPGVGVDAEGQPTTDPAAILEGGVQLPFGGHKGGLIALMVELVACALCGGLLAIEDRSAGTPGAASANSGQFILAIDPAATSEDAAGFAGRVDLLAAALGGNGEARLPGARRQAARAQAEAVGISVDAAALARLRALSGAVAKLLTETRR